MGRRRAAPPEWRRRLNPNTLLYRQVLDRYDTLTESEVKTLVVDDKWFASIRAAVEGEEQRMTQNLAGRVRKLEELHARPLPEMESGLDALSAKVESHLAKMGMAWR